MHPTNPSVITDHNASGHIIIGEKSKPLVFNNIKPQIIEEKITCKAWVVMAKELIVQLL